MNRPPRTSAVSRLERRRTKARVGLVALFAIFAALGPSAGIASAWAAPPDSTSSSGTPDVSKGQDDQRTMGLADIRVTTEVSPKASKIGDVVLLKIAVDAPAGYTVNLPIGLRIEPFEVVDVREDAAAVQSGRSTRSFVVSAQHFSPTDTVIPAFALTVVTPQGEVSTVEAPATPVAVEALLANETDPARKPEDPAISLPYPNHTAELVIYSAIAALVIGTILSLIITRFFGAAATPVPVRVVPPHERALDEIRRIEGEVDERYDRDEVVDLYVDMSAVARAYLDGRFKIPAQEWTTEEIRSALRGRESDIYPLRASEIIHFFEEGDLIKFARLRPTREEPREALASLRSMVERTIPVSSSADSSADSLAAGDSGGAAPGTKAPNDTSTPAPMSPVQAAAAPRNDVDDPQALGGRDDATGGSA